METTVGPQGISEDAAEMESSNHGLAGCHIPGGAERTEAAHSHCHQPPALDQTLLSPDTPGKEKKKGSGKRPVLAQLLTKRKLSFKPKVS